MRELWRLPATWLNGRGLIRLATHITEFADGCLLIDGELHDRSFVGIADPRTGDWHLIQG